MIRQSLLHVLIIGASMVQMAAEDVVFFTQTADFTAVTGTTATFMVTTNIASSPVYAWLEDGIPLSNGTGIGGATTSTLSITATADRNGRKYACRASGLTGKFLVPAGPTVSAQATLTVVATPPALAITAPANGTALSGGQVYTFRTNRPGTVWTYNLSDRTGEPVSACKEITFTTRVEASC